MIKSMKLDFSMITNYALISPYAISIIKYDPLSMLHSLFINDFMVKLNLPQLSTTKSTHPTGREK